MRYCSNLTLACLITLCQVSTSVLKNAGVLVGRAFPPYDRWIRITIGLPEENRRAQAALRAALGKADAP